MGSLFEILVLEHVFPIAASLCLQFFDLMKVNK